MTPLLLKRIARIGTWTFAAGRLRDQDLNFRAKSMDRFLTGTTAAGAGTASQAAPALARGSDPDGLAELLVEGAAFARGAAIPSTWEVLARDGLARKATPCWHCLLCVAHGQNDGGGKGAQNVLLHMITKHVDRLPLEIARTVIVKMRSKLDNEV